MGEYTNEESQQHDNHNIRLGEFSIGLLEASS